MINEEELGMRLWWTFISCLIVATGALRLSHRDLILNPQVGSPYPSGLQHILQGKDVS